MIEDSELELYKKLDALRRDHRLLDEKITAALRQSNTPDEIAISRFKKEKLIVRDQIIELESILYPDIIA